MISEQGEWLSYVAIGLLVPMAAYLISKHQLIERHPTRLKVLLSLGLFGPALYLTFKAPLNSILLLLGISAIHFLSLKFIQRSESRDLKRNLFELLMIFSIWMISSRAMWFDDFDSWLLQSWATGLVFAIGFGLSFIVIYFATSKVQNRIVDGILKVGAITVFALCASRANLAYLDVSCIVGPIQLVRQGGWLLWDVPSQYGFLNILLASLAPFESSWMAVLFTNSVLLFISSLILFYLLIKNGAGTSHVLFSAIITLCTVFLMPAWVPSLVGVNALPSTGAFRFIWCYVLILVLWMLHERKDPRLLWLGSIAWVLGCFWSSESAFFSTLIWVPAAALTAHSLGIKFRNFCALSAGTLISATTILICYYLIVLGHFPDPIAFIEFAQVYKEGLGAIAIGFDGGLWIILSIYTLLLMNAFSIKSESLKANPFEIGLAFMVWTTFSYFIWRSHENQISNLTPIYMMALLLFALTKSRTIFSEIAKAFSVALVTILIVATLGKMENIEGYIDSLFEPRTEEAMVAKFVNYDRSIWEFLKEHNIPKSDPVIYFGTSILAPEIHKAWLPIMPANLFGFLSIDRQRIYLERYNKRLPASGWLLQSLEIANSKKRIIYMDEIPLRNPNVYRELLFNTHSVTKIFQNDKWQLNYFELLKPTSN